jgi:hypothetical protein
LLGIGRKYIKTLCTVVVVQTAPTGLLVDLERLWQTITASVKIIILVKLAIVSGHDVADCSHITRI